MTSRVKAVEQSVLRTFQEEIPSKYFSDKTEQDYHAYEAKSAYLYRDLLKFPPRMFKDTTLIDFGAGTGENTVYLARWGATCTLVEMNESAQAISKEVFAKYSPRYEDHRFHLSSIFDYQSPGLYDIVHCRGVLSHTADNGGAFSKIASFLKPGGYVIFGDPNKAGGFQNMLQRYIIYKFAKTPNEMVEVAEKLFKEDIDRSQRFIRRTRRAIIFDRWVVQSQNDPSVAEVFDWFDRNDLVLYSAWPPVVMPMLGDSLHHVPRFEPQSFKDLGVLTEAVWLLQNDGDSADLPRMLGPLAELAKAQYGMVDYVANCSMESAVDHAVLKEKIGECARAWGSSNLGAEVAARMQALLAEARELLTIVEDGDLDHIRERIVAARHLFKGAVGVRHTDYIAYRRG
jgi:2-polyprenyl-3-methyl-5-hydroxy-6-metoxy-1,4-benzoquinol methylase